MSRPANEKLKTFTGCMWCTIPKEKAKHIDCMKDAFHFAIEMNLHDINPRHEWIDLEEWRWEAIWDKK